jgi:hypothetical protein
MDVGERLPLDVSESPTKPSIRLPFPPLPASLPRVPLVSSRANDDGGPTRYPLPLSNGAGFPRATGAFPGLAGSAIREEREHGGG